MCCILYLVYITTQIFRTPSPWVYMKAKSSYFLQRIFVILLLLIFVVLLLLCIYAYNSGSCKIKKTYSCNDAFCLYKEFPVHLREDVKRGIGGLIENKDIQKRVNIETYPETLFNCALPNKKGITISTEHVAKHAPELIQYYRTELCKLVSDKIKMDIVPTDLDLQTTCALLIYENEGDWINWHYDYNYYDGRFFTVLIPITDHETCTEFQLKTDAGEVKSIQLTPPKSICFEGNFLYHRASKLCRNEKRVILSCQFVTENRMSWWSQLRLKIKDFAYTGKL